MARDASTSSPKGPLPRVSRQGKMINQVQTQDPKLAAEEALKIFLRPPRQIPNVRERSFLDTAKKSVIQIDGIPIHTYTWTAEPRAPFVLFSHGWLMNAASMAVTWAPPLLDAGFSVISWDHVGHGESGGDWADIGVFVSTIRTLAMQNRPLAGIIGFSVGATTAVLALVENPTIQCPRLVCLSSPTHMDTVIADFLRRHGCSEQLIPGMRRAFAERNICTPENIRRHAPNSLESTSVLIVQDRDDKVTTVADAEYLAGVCADSKIEFTQGLGHYGGVKNESVIKLATGFVRDGKDNHNSTRISKM